MRNGKFSLFTLGLLALCAALPAAADTEFRVRSMTRGDVPSGKGQCDIRLQVDDEVEVALRRDTVFIRTIAGRDARDDGSECNAPLPSGNMNGFNFEVFDRRNDIRLVAEPSRRNGFAAVVRIRDTNGGFGRYHFRISWALTGAEYGRGSGSQYDWQPGDSRYGDRPLGRDNRSSGMAWNNTTHYQGSGRGESAISGYGAERLLDASVDIDRGGRIEVSFRTNSGRPLTFTGEVMDQQGDTIKANVTSEDRRLRGPMYISLDNRRDVRRVTLEATDGRDRLRLNWERR
jgi:hypothetical protein